MGPIGYAIALGIGGALAAVLWTFAIGLGGGPGAMLTAFAMRRTGATAIPTWSLLLTVAGQLYVSLVFAAFVIQTTSRLLEQSSGAGNWVAWVVAFFVAVAPAFMALRDSARAEVRTVQHGATTLTAPLTVIGFFVFVFAPGVLRAGWGWVPYL